MLGPLPAGFLQTTPSDNTVDNDHQIAVALEQQQIHAVCVLYVMYIPEQILTLNFF